MLVVDVNELGCRRKKCLLTTAKCIYIYIYLYICMRRRFNMKAINIVYKFVTEVL